MILCRQLQRYETFVSEKVPQPILCQNLSLLEVSTVWPILVQNTMPMLMLSPHLMENL